MAHFVEELRVQAEGAIAAMREAALRAREVHASAELMRHMLTTAARMKHLPRADSVRRIVDEWLAAWALDRGWAHVAAMEALAQAFHDYALAPTDANDRAVRGAAAALDAAFAAAGLPVADQMAWRSACAHGWWAQIRPAPQGQGRTDREWRREPFWAEGCPPHCR
jgi:hypothetical protein